MVIILYVHITAGGNEAVHRGIHFLSVALLVLDNLLTHNLDALHELDRH